MKHIPFNTLAHYACMPQCRLIDVAKVNCNLFAANIKKYRTNGDNTWSSAIESVLPDNEAVQFYLFNHLVSLVKEQFTLHEILPDWAIQVLQEYKRVVMKQGIRLVSYMALICTRESRHMGAMDDYWWENHITKEYGGKCYDFHKKIRGKNSDVVAEMFMEEAPAISVGHFFKAIETLFFEGFFSKSYGGPSWGNIATLLNQFLHGEISQEMMIDNAYTLVHNGGPMFDKSMLYYSYSSEFIRLLDVQRSGQIPEYVIEHDTNGGESPSGLTDYQKVVFEKACEANSDKFEKYIDWYKVKAAGAISDCTYKIEQQTYKHGKPKDVAVVKKIDNQIGEFVVMPGVVLPIVKRAA